MITEKKYPAILWSSYRPGFTPKDLKIECVDDKGYLWLKTHKCFQNFIALLGFDYYQGSNLGTRMKREISVPSFQPHRNIYLKEELFKKIDADETFRNKMFNQHALLPASSGTICFKNGGSYMYRLLSAEDSATYHKAKYTDYVIPPMSKYYAIAFFVEGVLIGFEEGVFLSDGGITVNEDGYRQPIQDVGQFISFLIITLTAFYTNAVPSKSLKPQEGLNQTSQSFHILG